MFVAGGGQQEKKVTEIFFQMYQQWTVKIWSATLEESINIF